MGGNGVLDCSTFGTKHSITKWSTRIAVPRVVDRLRVVATSATVVPINFMTKYSPKTTDDLHRT